MPMKRSGRSVEAASRVIEIDDVLEATIASSNFKRARSELPNRLEIHTFPRLSTASPLPT